MAKKLKESGKFESYKAEILKTLSEYVIKTRCMTPHHPLEFVIGGSEDGYLFAEYYTKLMLEEANSFGNLSEIISYKNEMKKNLLEYVIKNKKLPAYDPFELVKEKSKEGYSLARDYSRLMLKDESISKQERSFEPGLKEIRENLLKYITKTKKMPPHDPFEFLNQKEDKGIYFAKYYSSFILKGLEHRNSEEFEAYKAEIRENVKDYILKSGTAPLYDPFEIVKENEIESYIIARNYSNFIKQNDKLFEEFKKGHINFEQYAKNTLVLFGGII